MIHRFSGQGRGMTIHVPHPNLNKLFKAEKKLRPPANTLKNSSFTGDVPKQKKIRTNNRYLLSCIKRTSDPEKEDWFIDKWTRRNTSHYLNTQRIGI